MLSAIADIGVTDEAIADTGVSGGASGLVQRESSLT
jgi:hypothetical protein